MSDHAVRYHNLYLFVHLRPTCDYRRLNAKTTPDCYPLPHIHDLTITMFDTTIFSKADLVRAYDQIPMATEDIPKTPIITPFGLFEFLRMPFGLENAAQTFPRYIHDVFRGLDFLYVYLYDRLITSSHKETHFDTRSWRSIGYANMVSLLLLLLSRNAEWE